MNEQQKDPVPSSPSSTRRCPVTDPTTPTPEQLREDATRLRLFAEDDSMWYAMEAADWLRAALALEEQAARMEANPSVNNAMEALDELHRQAQNADGSVGALVTMSSYYAIVASALLHPTAEGVTVQKGGMNGSSVQLHATRGVPKGGQVTEMTREEAALQLVELRARACHYVPSLLMDALITAARAAGAAEERERSCVATEQGGEVSETTREEAARLEVTYRCGSTCGHTNR